MRRWMVLLAAALIALAGSAAATSAGAARAATSPTPTTSAAETWPTLQRPLDDCLSALPPPGCGHAPEQPGDRGGWMQFTLFGLMILGLAFIGWRIARSARRSTRDAR